MTGQTNPILVTLVDEAMRRPTSELMAQYLQSRLPDLLQEVKMGFPVTAVLSHAIRRAVVRRTGTIHVGVTTARVRKNQFRITISDDMYSRQSMTRTFIVNLFQGEPEI